jgi:dTMP kinase
MSRGRFITFEGGEGAGKSTQVRRLVAALADAGIDALATREPGGAPGAEAVRAPLVQGAVDRWDPMSEALLHSAARREHWVRTVLPALEAGRWVVCDRFADSTMAYQGYGHRLGRQPIEALYALVVGTTAPDLTLILDLPVDDGLHRAKRSAGVEDRYERMGRDFHERLRQGFLDIAAREPGRCAVIDARPEPDAVAEAIRAAVAGRLGVVWS